MGMLGDEAGTGFALSVRLLGMPEDAAFAVTVPAGYARLSLAQLLEAMFPADEVDRLAVEETLDVAGNPDLPDIYDCFLPVFDQLREGLCRLKLTAGAGRPAELSDLVASHLPATPAASAGASATCAPAPEIGLELAIEPEYKPLDYAIAQGYAESWDELLAWLQWCTLLYFLDKHGYPLPALAEMSEGSVLRPIVSGLFDRRFLRPSVDTGCPEIAEEGRKFIGALLSETETCIDRFDIFKDALWDEDADAAEFDTGYGEDLRVQTFIAEGMNPVRTVFLLRLYDGSLDEFAPTWQALIGDPNFFDRLLEPVVNRCQVPEGLLQNIIEDGYAYLEARAEFVREERFQAQVAKRLRTSFVRRDTDQPPPSEHFFG